MVVDSDVQGKTRTFLGDNIGERLHDFRIGKCDIIRHMYWTLCLFPDTQLLNPLEFPE